VKKTTVFQLSGGLVIAGAGLYVFFSGVKIPELLNQILSIPWWAVVCVVLLTFLTLWLRSVRWNLILPQSPSASRRDLFGIIMIGFMVNNILPARLGEAARMLLLWKRNKFTAAESIGSVLLERFLDSIVFLSFFFIPAFFMPQLREALPFARPLACGVSAACIALVFYAFLPLKVRALSKSLLMLFPPKLQQRLLTIGKEFVSNLDWIFSLKKCLFMLFLSFCTVACHAVMMMILAREATFTFLSGMFGAAWAALGAAIPFSPGYVGTLHAALKHGLIMTGCGPAKAAAVATVYHAIGYLTVTIFGFVYIIKMRISFKEIGRAKEELEKEDLKPCDELKTNN
jgi:uncharacterized protein (TIRG00374 family)